jgi:NTP pyrophosphatase (non-canonical NTP hydrolase)
VKTYDCNKPQYGRLTQLQRAIHENAVQHGWWEQERPVPEVLCLIHSEVSEALEAYRKGDKENFAEELADIAIRLLDAAEGYGINLEAEILKKHEINKAREYRHGGKAC